MPRFIPNRPSCGVKRREFLWRTDGGFADLALADLMVADTLSASPLAQKRPHFPVKAKHCVFLFMNGGPSQVDTFDPKPALTKHNGKPYTGDAKVGSNGRAVGHLMQSPFEFTQHGQSGLPISSASNWKACYMPAAYQGTLFRGGGSPLLDLATPDGTSDRTQRRSLDLLKSLNEEHLKMHPDETELMARIESYELAYRMQMEAMSVVDADSEDAATREMYGLYGRRTADFGRKCLITRKLIEKGVHYIQLYSGGGHIEDAWDGHNDCITNHTLHAGETDKPIAALIAELKRTGLWDETLLVWGGEFGRTPTSEGVGKPGRDHDWHRFSMWMAGHGVKGGQAIGATDKLGFKAVEDRCHVSDLHATNLHLMGIDHTRLSFRHQGLDQRLTGVEERRVIAKALA